MSRPCSATARPWRSDQIRGGAVQSGQRGPAPELCKKALADYAAAKRENPSFPYLDRYITHTRAQACDWSRPDAEKGLIDGVRRGERTCEPFRLLSLSDNESDHLTCAESWVADKFSRGAEAPRPTSKNDGLIRVANLSPDFRNHATIARLIELHDRRQFRILGLPFGPKADNATHRHAALAAGCWTARARLRLLFQ